jgi:hypothetical protein
MSTDVSEERAASITRATCPVGSPSAFPGPLIKEGKHGGRSTFWATKKLAGLATDLHCVEARAGRGGAGQGRHPTRHYIIIIITSDSLQLSLPAEQFTGIHPSKCSS